MKIFIIGAAGYIGKNLVEHLVSEGHDVIVGLRVAKTFTEFPPNVKAVEIDLSSVRTYSESLDTCDAVVYLAGPGIAIKDVDEMSLIFDYLNPFITFLKLNAKLNNVPVIFSSSGGTVYGKSSLKPFNENDKLDPISPYGLLKMLMEKYLFYVNNVYKTKVLSLRISNPYGGSGHQKNGQGVIDVFIKRAMHNKTLEVWGEGASVRDFLHMSDLLAAFSAALHYEGPYRCLNIGSGTGTSIRDLLFELDQLFGYPLKKEYMSRRPLDLDYNVLDITLARDELGWSPKIHLREGLIRILENYAR